MIFLLFRILLRLLLFVNSFLSFFNKFLCEWAALRGSFPKRRGKRRDGQPDLAARPAARMQE
jgi:hypothetical protein